MNILIVEDEPTLAELLAKTLGTAGHDCFPASDLKEAEELLQKEPIEGITLDNLLPGGRGVFWLAHLRAHHPELVSRTVIFTGISLSRIEADMAERHGVPVLEKPMDLSRLAGTLEGLAGKNGGTG